MEINEDVESNDEGNYYLDDPTLSLSFLLDLCLLLSVNFLF